jgi:aspartate-semialdehyde dehydrogenase
MNSKKDIEQKKINVAVLGATGVVGQVFLHLLAHHPWFELSLISGSVSRNGKTYGDEVQWVLPVPMPETVENMKLEALHVDMLKNRGIKIIFSALPADVAKTVEPELRENHFYVFSNASALRYETDVPILIPEVNPQALQCIEEQGFPGKGFVVTNANCSTTGLAAALGPLRKFWIKEVFVSTYQSVSGAGYPGLSALDIMGNAIPYIPGEEDKMNRELKKILQLEADIYAHCVRIPVLFGHLETVWLRFEDPVETDDILAAWQTHEFKLPRGARTPYAAQTVCEDFHSSPDDGACARLPQNENSYITKLPRGARTLYAAQTVCEDFHSFPGDGAYARLPQNENSYITKLNGPSLPTLPRQPVVYTDHEFFPQPKMSFWGFPSGMQVFTGRLRKEGDKIGFTLLVNNLVKGAAGGSVANAELFIHTYEHFLKTGERQ